MRKEAEDKENEIAMVYLIALLLPEQQLGMKGDFMRKTRRYQHIVFFVSLVSCAFLLSLTTFVTTAGAAELFELKISSQVSPSAYYVWDIIEKGWDKEAGLKMTQQYFESGAAQVEALPSKQWVIATTVGSVPSIVAAMRYGTYVAAIGEEDSFTNAVLVRPDSPILKVTSTDPNYPKTYGSVETVKGKTVLVTTVSSAHYSLATWLKRIGLKEKDVVVKNMDQGQIMAAFESGVGDIAVLWEPFMFVGMSKGWKMVNEDSQKNANQINSILVDKTFGDEHPEIVAKFLREAVSPQNIEGYINFAKNWGGTEFTESTAELSLKWRIMYPLEEQLKYFDNSKGQSEVQKWFTDMGNFFVEQKKFTREEMDKVLKSGFITDKFLRMAAEIN
jgi:NitT/TauT family transport system substrate-binding protein/sulfonate transport system substrate-binding protein